MTDLFQDQRRKLTLAPGAVVLPGFAADAALLPALERVTAAAGFRHMETPGGHRMSVAMTNCGALGWVTDRRGYRYTGADPLTGFAWPEMPPEFHNLAAAAGERAGYRDFGPDGCLINRYLPGAKMALHQDRNERNMAAPIISVSLGLPATFLWGGAERAERPQRIRLQHGDVVVWGGPARLTYHGVAALADGGHPLLGRQRINLTFRKAG